MGPAGSVANPGTGRAGPAPVAAHRRDRQRRVPGRRARLPRRNLPPQALHGHDPSLQRGPRLRAAYRRRDRCSHSGADGDRGAARHEGEHADQPAAEGAFPRSVRERHRRDARQGRGEHLRAITSASARSGEPRGRFELVHRLGRRHDVRARRAGQHQGSSVVPAQQGARPVRLVARHHAPGCRPRGARGVFRAVPPPGLHRSARRTEPAGEAGGPGVP